MALETPQNLSNQTDLPLEVDQSLWKVICLGVAAVIFALGFGYALQILLAVRDLDSFYIALVFAVLFLSVFLLNTIFIKSRLNSYAIIVVEVFAIAANFYGNFSKNIFWGMLLAILFLISANYSGAAELQNLLKLKFWRIGKRTLPKAILALSLFISFAYYGHVNGLTWTNPEQFFISEQNFERILRPAVPLAQGALPGFDLSAKTGDFLNQIATNEIQTSPGMRAIPQALKQKAIDSAAKGLQSDVEAYIGGSIDLNATLGESLYLALISKLASLPSNITSVMPLIAATILFLTIMTFVWLFRWAATFIGLIIFEILTAVGFSIILIESRSREMVVLK